MPSKKILEPVFPNHDCNFCPRLKDFIDEQRLKYPDWHNGPVASFGRISSELLIVGLAPGLRGANRTGRPFTGDWAGDLLYDTLKKFNFASGQYQPNAQYKHRPDDSLVLNNCRIANAVRCVPPENNPIGSEMNQCRQFLTAEITAMKNIKVILCLGLISHNNVLKSFGLKQSYAKFTHQRSYDLPNDIKLFDSYHCSRYNTNTGRLTITMFEDVFHDIKNYLGA